MTSRKASARARHVLAIVACFLSGCSPYRGYGGSGVDEVAALRAELERHRVVVASIPALERDNRALRARLEHLRKVEKSLGKSRP